MTQSESMRTRIVRYAERAKELEGQSYKETADKLGIGTRTLRRYRKGYEGDRADGPATNLGERSFPDVSQEIRERMKRGGKLTQLRNNLKERNQPDVPEDAPQPPEGERAFPLGDSQVRTPALAPDGVQQVGREETPALDEAILRDTPVSVTLQKIRSPSGRIRWEIREEEPNRGEVLDTVRLEIETERVLDSIELEGILWSRVLPIVYDNRE